MELNGPKEDKNVDDIKISRKSVLAGATLTRRKTILVIKKPTKRWHGILLQFHSFYPGWGKDIASRFLVVMFWIALITGGLNYIWIVYQLVKWTYGFYKIKVYSAIWMHAAAMAIGCGWVPMALLISDWEKETRVNRRLLYCIYFLGVIISLVLEGLSIWYVTWYEELDGGNAIYQDWMNETGDAIRSGHFPQWIIDYGGVDCCAWKGPLDFGVTFTLKDIRGPYRKIQRATMDNISICYNSLFVTYTNNRSKIGFRKGAEMEELPPGCGYHIGEAWRILSFTIIVSGVFQMIISFSTLLGYTIYPFFFFKTIRKDIQRRTLTLSELPEHAELRKEMISVLFPPADNLVPPRTSRVQPFLPPRLYLNESDHKNIRKDSKRRTLTEPTDPTELQQGPNQEIISSVSPKPDNPPLPPRTSVEEPFEPPHRRSSGLKKKNVVAKRKTHEK